MLPISFYPIPHKMAFIKNMKPVYYSTIYQTISNFFFCTASKTLLNSNDAKIIKVWVNCVNYSVVEAITYIEFDLFKYIIITYKYIRNEN